MTKCIFKGNKTSLCFCKSHESTRIGQGSFNFPGAVYTLWLSKHYYMALIKPTGIAAAHFTWKCLLEKKKSNLVPWKLQVTLPENNLRSYSVRDGGLPLKNCMVLTICRYLWSSPKYFLWKRRVDWERVCWSFEQIWAMGIVDMADHESAHTPTCWSTFAFYNFLHFQSHWGPGLFMIMFRTSSWANALVTLFLLLSFTGHNFNLALKGLGFQFSLTQPPIIT